MANRFNLGEWQVEPELNTITCAGREIRLEPKVMALLVCLSERAGAVVSKDELMRQVWTERYVTDEVLTTSIWELRRALGDDAKKPRFIQTVSRKGYRLIAPVSTQAETNDSAPPPSLPASTTSPPPRTIRWKKPALAISLALALTLAFTTTHWLRGDRNRAEIQSIAVLPLDNITHEAENEAFTSGMTEALITTLAKLPSLRVVSRSSAVHYKATNKPAPELARELGVDAVLEGAVLRTGNRVRVTLQLVNAATDRHLWAESYERPFGDPMSLQDEIARAAAVEVRQHLDWQRRTGGPELSAPVTAEAYETYLKGRQAWAKRTEEGVRHGLELFERAAQLAPDYAPAYAGQADAWIQLALLDALRPGDAYPKAKTAALNAVQLDSLRAEAHTSLAMIRFCYEWDWAEAETGFKHAIALNPAYATARNWYGQYLWAAGRLDEAQHEIRLAQEFEPYSIAIQLTAGGLHAMRGQDDQAIEAYRRVIALDAGYAVAWKSLGKLYQKKAMKEDALAAWQRFRELTGMPPASQTLPQFAQWNRKDDPQYLLNKLSLLWRLKYIRPTYVARLYLDLGDKERAFEWLDKALSERDSDLLLLRSDRSWDALRTDPRFAALAGRVGLSL